MTDTPASSPPSALLAASFPKDVLEVLARLHEAGHQAFLVGGSIRDLLLGKTAKDYDVATSARAEAVVKLFRKVIPTGIKHGTVTVLTRSLQVEVTTFRGEGAYLDGRRPEQVFFLDNVVDDLARRDFTINAMAYDPRRQAFVDPFAGALDLAARRIRCVGDANQRFSEDGLRPLRAVRFASVLGFEIDPPTFAAIAATLSTFAKIARERVREELSKLLVGPTPSRGLRLLGTSGLLPGVLPQLAALTAREPERLERAALRVDAIAPGLELRLAALLRDLGPEGPAEARRRVEAELEGLRYPRKVIETAARLAQTRDVGLAPYPDDASLRRALAAAGRDLVDGLLALAHAEASTSSEPERAVGVEELGRRIAALLATHPPLTTAELALNGQQIMQILGASPGPRIGVAARHLLDQVLEDPARNTPASLEALLRAWNPPDRV